MSDYRLSHLDYLEAESIHIFRELAGQFERPVMLYSAGKDSSVLLHLARKAYAPGKLPFPLMHVDTGFKFQEMYDFRDFVSKEYGLEMLVHRNEEAIANDTNPYELGTQRCCALLKTEGLLGGLRKGNYDAAIGGARRDEEASRAKERIFSFRDKFGQWDPKSQRPELWSTYNGKIAPGESIRVFPLSNWTELDVWHYIAREHIPIASLYFAKEREVVIRNDQLIPVTPRTKLFPGEKPQKVLCRFRTLGCSPCTGAVHSAASSVEEIIAEILDIRISERSTRIIDHDSAGSMETKKREGYF